MKKRLLFIGVVSEERDNIFSLLPVLDNQYSLSDQQMKDIENCLIVKNIDDYVSKFGDRMPIRPKGDVENQDDNLDLFKKELLRRRDVFDVFYSDGVVKDNKSDDCIVGNRMYFEVLESLKLFFRQRQDDSEILILNIGTSYGFTSQEQKVIRLYLETANTKLDNQYKIDAVIVPGLYFPKPTRQNVRQRFMGSKEAERSFMGFEQILVLSNLLENLEIPILLQYEGMKESGPQGFAEYGDKIFKQGSNSLVENGIGNNVMICYPNLSSTNTDIYVGAAFAVAALAGEEGSAIPRELYPYTEAAKEDVNRADFGAMLIYSGDRMRLACQFGLRGKRLDV